MSLIIPDFFDEITYVINVVSMKTSTHLGMPNVVKFVEYELQSTYEKYQISSSHTVEYDLSYIENVDDFSDFNTLTEKTVISWIESSEGFIHIRYSQADQIQQLINKNNEEVSLPWTIEE